MRQNIIGTVTAQAGKYWQIECPDAPGHLRSLSLVSWQLGGASVGDTVELAYQVTPPSSGLWNVVRIVERAR